MFSVITKKRGKRLEGIFKDDWCSRVYNSRNHNY